MLDIKSLKFEKSINYLKEQLEMQNNNKQLVEDIMKNLSVLIDNSKDAKEQKEYQNIYNSASKHLQNISTNIETLEKLNSTIGLLAIKLTKLAEAEKGGSKTKQYLISAFAQFKDEVISYTRSLQNLNKKIVDDTKDFNEFININNFKYNFSSIPNDEESNSNYEYTGFSVKDKNVDSIVQDNADETNLNVDDLSIDDLDIDDINIEDINIEDIENDEAIKNINDLSYFSSLSDILKNTALSDEDLIEEDSDEDVSNEEVSDEAPKKRTLRKSAPKAAKKGENKTEEENKEEKGKVKNTKKAESKTEKKTKTTKKSTKASTSSKSTKSKTTKSKSTKAKGEKKSTSTTSKTKKASTNAKTSTKRVLSISKKISNVTQSKANKEIVDNPVPADESENNVAEDLLSNFEVQDLISDLDINETDLNVNANDNNVENNNNDVVDNSDTNNKDDANVDVNNDDENNGNKENLENLESRFEAKLKDLENFEANKESTDTSTTVKPKEKIEDIVKNNDFSQFPLDNITDKITDILSAKLDNETLLISEKTKTIYLPYKISELTNYMDSYPDVYNSVQDVVRQEFILPFDYFMKHPYKARFSEAYNILRNREGKGFIPSVTYSLNIARRYNLNPAIVAACKSQNELESYLYYLDTNNAHRFNFFNIIYEVSPLAKNNKKN